MVEKDDPSVQIRVYVLGEFLLERKRADETWEMVDLSSPTWGKGTYGSNTRRLLGYLLFCDRRRSFRFAIKEALWPHHPLSTSEYLTRATTSLCDLLVNGQGIQLLANRERYQLADQSHIWVDAEYCEELLAYAQRVGDATDQGIAKLERAQGLFHRGRFLEEELGSGYMDDVQNCKPWRIRACCAWLMLMRHAGNGSRRNGLLRAYYARTLEIKVDCAI